MNQFISALTKALSGKSKTINFNTVITALLIWYCQTHRIDITPEVAMTLSAAFYGMMNVFLRFMTNLPLAEKGRQKEVNRDE